MRLFVYEWGSLKSVLPASPGMCNPVTVWCHFLPGRGFWGAPAPGTSQLSRGESGSRSEPVPAVDAGFGRSRPPRPRWCCSENTQRCLRCNMQDFLFQARWRYNFFNKSGVGRIRRSRPTVSNTRPPSKTEAWLTLLLGRSINPAPCILQVSIYTTDWV